jgi:hypothetical protein
MHDIAWAAGLFEGEGCISLNKEGKYIVSLQMCDEDVVRSFAEVIGYGTVLGPYQRSKYNPNARPLWRWHAIKRGDVYAVLKALLPYLHSRRTEKAELAISGIRGELISEVVA